jgi:hypothetical protein
MQLTQVPTVNSPGNLCRPAFALAAGTCASMLLLACSAEPGDALSDTSPSGTTFSALHTANQTSASSPAAQSPDPKAGSAEVSITFNHAPRVSNMLSDLGRLDVGDQAKLRAVADDPDGDFLAYEWATKCRGTFDHPNSATPTFVLVAIPPSGSCDLVVRVTDGRGGENHGTLTLGAGAPPPIVVADPSSDS